MPQIGPRKWSILDPFWDPILDLTPFRPQIRVSRTPILGPFGRVLGRLFGDQHIIPIPQICSFEVLKHRKRLNHVFWPFWPYSPFYPFFAHFVHFGYSDPNVPRLPMFRISDPFEPWSNGPPFGPHFGGLKRTSQSGPWGAGPGLTPFGPLLDLFEVLFPSPHAVWLTHGTWVRGPSLDLFWALSLQYETSCFDMSGVQNARVAVLGWPILSTYGTCGCQKRPTPF